MYHGKLRAGLFLSVHRPYAVRLVSQKTRCGKWNQYHRSEYRHGSTGSAYDSAFDDGGVQDEFIGVCGGRGAAGRVCVGISPDTPQEAGVYPDNVTKEVYEKEYRKIAGQAAYVSNWTVPKMLKCKEVWLTAMVPGFITLGLLGVITQFVQLQHLSWAVRESGHRCHDGGGADRNLRQLYDWLSGHEDRNQKSLYDLLRNFALGIFFNLLAAFWLPFVYLSIFIVGFSLGGSTNMSLSFPASVFGVLDYPKVNGVIFPINYCIGCLNFLVNAVVMKITGSLTGAYIVYMCLFW